MPHITDYASDSSEDEIPRVSRTRVQSREMLKSRDKNHSSATCNQSSVKVKQPHRAPNLGRVAPLESPFFPGSKDGTAAMSTRKSQKHQKVAPEVPPNGPNLRSTGPNPKMVTKRKRKATTPDPTTGLSKTKGALDSRRRKVEERELRDRLVTLIDPQISQWAEDQGGITPAGRMYKALIRTIEIDRDQLQQLQQQAQQHAQQQATAASRTDQLASLDTVLREFRTKFDESAILLNNALTNVERHCDLKENAADSP